MNNSLSQLGSDTHQTNQVLPSSKNLGDILLWLMSLIQLTEEEQESAGIYHGH